MSYRLWTAVAASAVLACGANARAQDYLQNYTIDYPQEEPPPEEVLPAAVAAELAPKAPPTTRLPDSARELILTAMRGNDDRAVHAIARTAKAAYPLAENEIADMLATWNEETSARSDVMLALADDQISIPMMRLRPVRLPSPNPRFLTGRGELGGFRSTGSTSEVGLSMALALNYKIGRWQHKLNSEVNYRRSNGATSQENISVAYEPRLQFSPDLFVYGLAQYERAPFVGYNSRLTSSGGLGAVVIARDNMRLLATAGPAFRRVDYVLGDKESKLGLRSSLDFNWQLSPTARFTQTANGYLEDNVVTLNFDSGITTKIATRLSTRFSYNVQVEHVGDPGNLRYLRRFDTMSRVSIVYDF